MMWEKGVSSKIKTQKVLCSYWSVSTDTNLVRQRREGGGDEKGGE